MVKKRRPSRPRKTRVKAPERLALKRPRRLPPEDNWWKRQNGSMILVRDMSHLHLMNAARMLLRQAGRYRAEHDSMVKSLIRFHGECSEFAKLIAKATNLSDFDFMARFHGNFRKLWSELSRRNLTWVVKEDMQHPDEMQPMAARGLQRTSYDSPDDDFSGDR